MPRPRHDSEILPAKERLESAFWALLEERPFPKITVTDVVREAQVNRNSFYYHFSGLDELADSTILHEVERLPLPTMLDPTNDPTVEWRHYCATLLHYPVNRQIIDRLALLSSENSTPDLVDSLRDFLRLTLMSIFNISPNALDSSTEILIDFTVGGMLALLGKWSSMRGTLSVNDLVDRNMAILATGLFLSISQEDTTDFWRRVYLDSARMGTRSIPEPAMSMADIQM